MQERDSHKFSQLIVSQFNLKKVGTDLDSALLKGLGNVFQISLAYKCAQLMQER